MQLRAARRRVRLGRSYRVGRATWYVVGTGSTRGLVKVTRGVVGEVGVAEGRSVRRRAAARRLLAGL